MGPNGHIKREQEEDHFRPGRKRVHTKPSGTSGFLKWKVDEVRLRDNRPLSLKFNKKRAISPKITQKRAYNLDKVNARMEQIKRELRENMHKDVHGMEAKFKGIARNEPPSCETNFYSRKQSKAANLSTFNQFGSNRDYDDRELPPSFDRDQVQSNGFRRPSSRVDSRVRIDSRKEYLKQTIQREDFASQQSAGGSNQREPRQRKASFYSPFAEEFHSRNDNSVSPNRVAHEQYYTHDGGQRSRDCSQKKQIVMTPKRRRLMDEFQSSKMN